jgi:hypothetical protein
MNRFDPASMAATTSPTVRALRTMVERTMEAEIDTVAARDGAEAAHLVEASLRAVVFAIFHHNPLVHTVVHDDMYAFDEAVQRLFGINPSIETAGKD